MRLEITTTPRETLVWAPTTQDAGDLRRLLAGSGHLVLDADPSELDFFDRVPDNERDDFDRARIINVEIGADAFASLTALVDAGHELWWHRWQSEANHNGVWGVEVRSDRASTS